MRNEVMDCIAEDRKFSKLITMLGTVEALMRTMKREVMDLPDGALIDVQTSLDLIDTLEGKFRVQRYGNLMELAKHVK